jgi:hypothetical protein
MPTQYRETRRPCASHRRKGNSDKPNAPCGLVLCGAVPRFTPRRADPRLTPAIPHRAKADQGQDPFRTMAGKGRNAAPAVRINTCCHAEPTAGTETRPPQRSVAGQTARPSSLAPSISPRKPAWRQQAGPDPVAGPLSRRAPVTVFQQVFRRAGQSAVCCTRARTQRRRYGTWGRHTWPQP